MKKILLLLSVVLLTLTSCNQLVCGGGGGGNSSVTVSGSQILSRQVVDGYDENAVYSITFEMSGDYSEQITKSGTIKELQSQSFSFTNLLVGSKVKFRCTLYYHDGTPGGKAIWSGESDEIEIAEGANNVSIKMKKLFKEIEGKVFDSAAFIADLEANYSDKVTFGLRDGVKVITECTLERYAVPYGYETIKGNDSEESVFYGCTNLTNIIIPDSITTIGDYAFNRCSWLTSIKVPESVTKIGNYAFSFCTNLSEVNIPKGLTSLGQGAFQSTKISSVEIPSGVTVIESYAFDGCYKLESVKLPENLKIIWDHAFNGFFDYDNYNTVLKTIELPSKLEKIAQYAFQNQKGLESITIPANVTEIGDFAFDECTALKTVNVKQSDPSKISLGSYVFDDDVKAIYVPYGNGVNGNGGAVPYYRLYRETVKWTDYADIIHTLFTSNDVPRNLSKYYTVPAGYTVIAANAFEGRTVLEGVTVSAEVEFIEANAFLNCTNLQAVALKRYEEYDSKHITDAVVKETGAAADAPDSFKGCHENLTIYVPCTNDDYNNNTGNFYKQRYPNAYNITGGILDSDSLNYFIPGFIPGTSTECNIPYGYTAIADGTYYTSNDTTTGVFSEFTDLTTVTLPESLETIGAWAFYKCTSLSDFTIPSSVTLINEGAFSYCSNLVSVELSNNLTSIAAKTFDNCRELTDVNIPDGVISIGEKAFNLCVKLESVKIKIPKTIKTIGGEAFYGCSSLTSITIPSSVINLGSSSDNDGAFAYCTGLTEVTIENGVETIGQKAFRGCSNLESIDIPASVTQIGKDAFYSCSKLATVYIRSSGSLEIGDSAFSSMPDGSNVYLYATTPPTLIKGTNGVYVFPSYKTFKTLTFHVPSSSKTLYDACVADSSNNWSSYSSTSYYTFVDDL